MTTTVINIIFTNTKKYQQERVHVAQEFKGFDLDNKKNKKKISLTKITAMGDNNTENRNNQHQNIAKEREFTLP